MTSNRPNPLEKQDVGVRHGWTPLLDAMPQGVMLVDAGGRYLEVNSTATEILGMDRETLLALSIPDPWRRLSAADGTALAVEEFPGLVALRTGTPVRRKALGWNRENAGTTWLKVSAEPLQGGGALVSFDIMNEHPLQSRKLEHQSELYSALSQVNQAIVWSPTRENLLDKVCEVMVEFGKFKLAWIGWDDPVTHEVRISSQCGDSHGYLHGLQVRSDDTPLGRGGTGTAIREGRICVINDFLGSPEASPWHETTFRFGFAASASIPIRYDGKVCAALVVYASEKDFFGSQEISLLEELARDVAFALDHYELETQHKQDVDSLKVSEQKYRNLFETMREGVALHEVVRNENGEVKDYRILDVNPAFRRHTGLDPFASKGRLASELYGAPAPPYLEEYTKVALTGEPCDFEVFFEPLNKHFRISIYSPTQGQFATVFEDITERKRNLESLLATAQRLELATASASMGVWDWDLQSGSMAWDHRMFELYGATHGEICGTVQDWKDRLHPEDLDRAIAECEAAVRGEAPFDTEFRVKHRNGTILWIKANAVVLRDQEGKPVRMIGINQDITEAKQAIEKVKLFEVSINSSIDGAYWMNNEGRFIYVNPTACKMLGYSRDELLQMSLFDVAPNRNITNWSETVQHLRINGHYFSEAVHRRKDGSEFPVEISTTMIAVNNIEYINGFARDITDRKKAEEFLQSQAALLKAQMNATIDGILVVSEQGKRRLLNDRLIALFDIPRNIIADEDDASLLDHVAKRTINRDIFLEKVDYLYKNMNEISHDEIEFTNGMILDRYSAPVLGDDGKYFGRIWTFRDISERKKAEKALRYSEERYRNQFDMAGEGIFALSPEGEFLEANGAFARMHGYTVKEMVNMKLKDFVTPEILAGVGNDRLHQLLEGKSLIFETEHIHKDGHVFPVEVSACEVSTGGKQMILGFHRDITERKSLESALERKIIALTRPMVDIGELAFEELFDLGNIQKIQDALAQATGVASIITRPDGTPITRPSNFTYLCSEIIRKTEKGRLNCFESDATIGSYHSDGPIVQQCFTCGLWDAGTSISVGGYHVANWLIGQVRDESQSQETMAACAREFGVDEGMFLKAFNDVPSMSRKRLNQIAESLFVLAGRLSDSAYQNVQQARFISDKNAAEAEVYSLNQTLEQRVKERTAQVEAANRELEAFSYSVSHDLRAPLRSIDGFSQILLEDYLDKLDEEGKHLLSRIRSGTQRMGHLIDDLLKLSKTNRSELAVSDCNLDMLCSRVAGELAERNPERRVEVFIQPEMLVQADNNLMQVVVENLLANAWKFTSKGEAPRIEVGETFSPDGERIFFIRDNGAGFDMAYADKLFNAFQRLHSPIDFEGTGIGLAIVQRIIHRHGGRIWAEAEVGRGAAFFFTLPEMNEY